MADQEEQTQTSSKHGVPTEGMCCLCTYEDITLEDGNYVEYQTYPSLEWKPALFELSVIQSLLESQFQKYIEQVKKTDCQAELRRLLESGPPIYVSDKVALPLPDGDEYVSKLWFACDNTERSAKLVGAVDGEEREKLWDELRQFIVVGGADEDDAIEKEE
mmetsp:Transcript_12994/g.19801  ORF Transcript_12994/g.19801 Transcript_12994/m.19801 type:complete len:161 (-) Transcript_12994:165-647(-)|eukprot:CAMPEP_0196805436 /NCGR_PEP_ID=MMETSP1362-20130617/5202_1 /TAXON_ID=163516 /ORGANISM="Leptocylindrus danicus, Strain CCMP1856" /LENGTH=160 /DNA_ID=CAMNT_0042178349 /DNA_START=95 /DNA_END=577 /DNA_ORIENTATION=-